MAKRRRRASGARKLLIVMLLAVSAVALILYLTKGGGKVENEYLGMIEINEVMSSNKGSVPDETGAFPDWIEVYNNTDSKLDISGFGLTDDLISAAKWTFPEGSVLEPHGFLVVFCSGDPARGSRPSVPGGRCSCGKTRSASAHARRVIQSQSRWRRPPTRL